MNSGSFAAAPSALARVGIDWSGTPGDGFCRALPCRRQWGATAICGGLLAPFSGPLFSLSDCPTGAIDDLSSLTTVVFMGCWTLNWSAAVGLLTLTFLALLLSRSAAHCASCC